LEPGASTEKPAQLLAGGIRCRLSARRRHQDHNKPALRRSVVAPAKPWSGVFTMT